MLVTAAHAHAFYGIPWWVFLIAGCVGFVGGIELLAWINRKDKP